MSTDLLVNYCKNKTAEKDDPLKWWKLIVHQYQKFHSLPRPFRAYWLPLLFSYLIYTYAPSMQKIIASTDHDRWSVGKWCSVHRPRLCGFHALPSRLTSVRYPFGAGWLRDALGPGNKSLPWHGFEHRYASRARCHSTTASHSKTTLTDTYI